MVPQGFSGGIRPFISPSRVSCALWASSVFGETTPSWENPVSKSEAGELRPSSPRAEAAGKPFLSFSGSQLRFASSKKSSQISGSSELLSPPLSTLPTVT